MSRLLQYLISVTGITVMLEDGPMAIATDHPKFRDIRDALKTGRHEDVPGMIDITKAVHAWLVNHLDISLTGGLLTYNGEAFSDIVTRKVLNMIELGNSPDALVNFLRKVRLNPSNVAQQELLLFCDVNGFMIHEDGDILAYKAVRDDFTDSYSGTFDNTPGTGVPVEVPRHTVDDRRERTCSRGLHFAALGYATMFSGGRGHIVVLKLNPRDVVSIPNDYENQKGRCCRYFVLREVPNGIALPQREVYSDRDVFDFDRPDYCPDEFDDDDGYDDDDECGCSDCVANRRDGLYDCANCGRKFVYPEYQYCPDCGESTS